jgi:O-antigen/teichoic acid export membrane protein
VNKYITLLTNLLRHELISGSIFVLVGGTAGSLFAFLLNLFLARNLSYSDYGIYIALISLFTVMTIPASSLTATVVQFAARYIAKNELEKAAGLYRKMTFIWFSVGALIALSIIALEPLLLPFLHINDPLLVLITALSVGLAYFGIVNTAYLQSMTKFFYFSLALFLGSAIRLISGVSLVKIGFGPLGGVVAILSTPLTVLLLSFIPLMFVFRTKINRDIVSSKEIVFYSVPAIIGLVSLSLFITTDTILVKHYFSPDSAGLYGGLSIVGKVIFYFTALIPSVMFPLIVRRHEKGEVYHNLYLLSLIMVFLPSITAVLIYLAFPGFVLNLFLGGGAYLQMGQYLGLYGIFIAVFSLLSLSVNFFLSIRKTKVSYLTLLFAVLQIVLIFIFHNNFYEVILSSIISVSLLFVLLLLYFYYSLRA